MYEIPLLAEPSQRFNITLDDQNCTIRLFYKDPCMYMDLDVGAINIWQGFICLNEVGIKLYPYLNFKGQLMFKDTQGKSDPQPDGLGTRWKLFYGTEAEFA